MIRWLAMSLLQAVALPGTIDTCIRLTLRHRAAGPRSRDSLHRPRRMVAVVPSRDDAARIGDTLHSIARAASSGNIAVRAIALLDGDDAAAAAAAQAAGAEVLVKQPAGPRKADALEWLATRHRALIESADAILLIDAGTQLCDGFFRDLEWDARADALQCRIESEGTGLALAIASSESAAFAEDAAKVAAGWNPRFRGSGMIATPRFFLELVPQLRTQVEDWELSLLAGARGFRVTLAPAQCVIIDTKPAGSEAAARQRARWLAGQCELILGRRSELFRFVARDPLQGLSFAAELLSRPRSLALPARVAAGIGIAVLGRRSTAARLLASAVLLTAAADLSEWAKTTNASTLVRTWVRAISFLPAARKRWLSANDR
ncbi:MAG TPA: glycosyltransferase [Thermoanaerobaculia bacterium]|nr:glycosyltransferase [Thermoanaerobaculia bacterium]